MSTKAEKLKLADEWLCEVEATAWKMRYEGASFDDIGKALGVGRDTAELYLKRANRNLNSPYQWDKDLSVRISNVLGNAGIQNREEVRRAYLSGELSRLRNLGWKSYVEIAEWLGLPKPEKSGSPVSKLKRLGLFACPLINGDWMVGKANYIYAITITDDHYSNPELSVAASLAGAIRKFEEKQER